MEPQCYYHSRSSYHEDRRMKPFFMRSASSIEESKLSIHIEL